MHFGFVRALTQLSCRQIVRVHTLRDHYLSACPASLTSSHVTVFASQVLILLQIINRTWNEQQARSTDGQTLIYWYLVLDFLSLLFRYWNCYYSSLELLILNRTLSTKRHKSHGGVYNAHQSVEQHIPGIGLCIYCKYEYMLNVF